MIINLKEKKNQKNILSPVGTKERYVILDVLRGLALLGICMANLPEFSLYTFLQSEIRDAMPSYEIDYITRYFIYIFIDGKFYTIFSLLFGIGFSIIIANASKKGADGFKIFYRRMFVLLCFGFLHLMLVWSGDILMLYALMGMLLPLFMKLKDKALLCWAFFFLIFPVVLDTFCEAIGLSLSAPFLGLQNYYCEKFGITDDNFAYWLRDATEYKEVLKFLIMGACERMWEFVDGNRYFKVLGLFLVGYYIGRHKFFASLSNYKSYLVGIARWGIMAGIPLSVLYAWSAMNGHPWGRGLHGLIYFISVYLTSFGYISIACLLYLKNEKGGIWRILALPGRMALSNYIFQSLAGILIFYGLGFGYGASVSIFNVEILAVTIFIYEIMFSYVWLSAYRFGPLEWIWRCLTYNRVFPLRLRKEGIQESVS